MANSGVGTMGMDPGWLPKNLLSKLFSMLAAKKGDKSSRGANTRKSLAINYLLL